MLRSSHPRLVWVREGSDSKPEFHEEEFPGSPEEAIAALQSRANSNELFFGQVLTSDGRVISNVAPQAT